MDRRQMQEIGIRIAELRRSHKLTQEALAETLGVSKKHISHVERGCASLSMGCLAELSRLFDCSLDYIVFGEPEDKAYTYLPDTISEILHSGQTSEINRLIRYLEVYIELRNK